MNHLKPDEPEGPPRPEHRVIARGVPLLTPRVENLYRVYYDVGHGEEWQYVMAPSVQEASDYMEWDSNLFLTVRHVVPIPFDLTAGFDRFPTSLSVPVRPIRKDPS